MSTEKIDSILHKVKELSVVDEDVMRYLGGMLCDELEDLPVDTLQSKIQPFLEAFDIPEQQIPGICVDIHSQMTSSGLISASSRKGASDVSVKSMLRDAGLLGEGRGEERGGPKLLGAPLTLGQNNNNTIQPGGINTLDMLWGKETNAFLNANKQMDDSTMDAKAAKKAARDARKDDAKKQYADSQAAAKAAAEAAAMLAEGAVSSGTVTYRITTERKPQDVNISSFNMGYGGELLLEAAELRISMGRRYGLVGRNGMGKSTLLRHMARGDIMGAGSQGFPTNMRVLHVEQEVTGSGATVLETVLGADVERKLLLDEEARLLAAIDGDETAAAESASGATTAGIDKASAVASDAATDLSVEPVRERIDIAAANARIAEIGARLEAIDSDSAESRACSILSGLGFSKEMNEWPTKSLSGGWRMRVALACALFCEPDILCLDEPTNHIDAKSVMWLVDYLLSYPHTLIVVSHDRWFLNAVCTDIIHLLDKKLAYYKGDYDTYERTRAERRRHMEKASETQDAKRKHIQSFIDKFRYNAKRASLVQSRIKALERMEVLEDVADDPKWKFEFPDPGPLGMPVLQIDDVSFGYRAGKPLFRGVNFSIDMSSRIALVGPNGVGKSTLLKLILGELEAQEGAVQRNTKLRMACFTQHHINQLDLSMTPLDFLLSLFPGSKPDEMRAHLGSFGLGGDLALQTMGTMSGGQKSRVAFSVLTWKKPHVLVLDEPSNNLDIETIDAVIVALANFAGGVILVSHDQHFVESVCDEIFVVGTPAGRVSKFKGEFKDYRKVAEAERAFKVDGEE